MIGLIGSTGTLGRELMKHGKVVRLHTRRDFDLKNLRSAEIYLRSFLEGLKAVINAAAYTNVDGAEKNPELATLINADFPKVLAKVAREMGVRLVHVSTDYVFDGKVGFYYEEDYPQPLGVYGKSKRLGEVYVLEENPDAIVIRTSWLYGPGGKNFFSRLPLMLAKGEEVRAHDLQLSSPTSASFLSESIFEMLEKEVEGGIYHITGREPTSPYRAALALADAIGSKSKIVLYEPPSSYTSIRPRVSVLLSSRYKYKPPPFIQSVLSIVSHFRRST